MQALPLHLNYEQLFRASELLLKISSIHLCKFLYEIAQWQIVPVHMYIYACPLVNLPITSLFHPSR